MTISNQPSPNQPLQGSSSSSESTQLPSLGRRRRVRETAEKLPESKRPHIDTTISSVVPPQLGTNTPVNPPSLSIESQSNDIRQLPAQQPATSSISLESTPSQRIDTIAQQSLSPSSSLPASNIPVVPPSTNDLPAPVEAPTEPSEPQIATTNNTIHREDYVFNIKNILANQQIEDVQDLALINVALTALQRLQRLPNLPHEVAKATVRTWLHMSLNSTMALNYTTTERVHRIVQTAAEQLLTTPTALRESPFRFDITHFIDMDMETALRSTELTQMASATTVVAARRVQPACANGMDALSTAMHDSETALEQVRTSYSEAKRIITALREQIPVRLRELPAENPENTLERSELIAKYKKLNKLMESAQKALRAAVDICNVERATSNSIDGEPYNL